MCLNLVFGVILVSDFWWFQYKINKCFKATFFILVCFLLYFIYLVRSLVLRHYNGYDWSKRKLHAWEARNKERKRKTHDKIAWVATTVMQTSTMTTSGPCCRMCHSGVAGNSVRWLHFLYRYCHGAFFFLLFFFLSFFSCCCLCGKNSEIKWKLGKHAGSDPEAFWLRPVMAITASYGHYCQLGPLRPACRQNRAG